ncbi:GNAT family N-acetyltransferase [Allobacillus sp. SKP2-8]|uniref:GNAT family N-acetyltransferase n=1 Tax=unclassified Allobacillus TaxID=2628859 RepID=UPI00118353D2|nr:GNAT family protein [Allobacillus sp. SKP2-8]TSJ68019.1 GNAT family N-acetyltransferase [Allobacillus sp. SKP2-8]
MFTYEVDEEISLKLIDEGDAETVFKLTDQSRDYLREWLPWIDMTTEIGDTRNFIKASKKMYAESKGLNTVILYNGEAAGIAGFNEVDWQNKIAYIGYWLGEGFQGKGIMTRATQALVDYAFEQLNLHKVDIRAAEENQKSRSIPERLGFQEEGKIRAGELLYGKYVDHVVYGLLKDEWEKMNASEA